MSNLHTKPFDKISLDPNNNFEQGTNVITIILFTSEKNEA